MKHLENPFRKIINSYNTEDMLATVNKVFAADDVLESLELADKHDVAVDRESMIQALAKQLLSSSVGNFLIPKYVSQLRNRFNDVFERFNLPRYEVNISDQ